MDLVYVENISKLGDANYGDLVLNMGREKIVIPPGEKSLTSLEIAVGFFGHPGEKNTQRNPDRHKINERLMFKWGYQMGQIGADEDWATKFPPFRVTNLEGEYVPMILDDPDGVLPVPGSSAPVAPATTTDIALIQIAMQQQQEQIAKLTEMLAAAVTANNPGIVPADVAKDTTAQSDASAIPAAKDDAVTGDVPRSTRIGNRG